VSDEEDLAALREQTSQGDRIEEAAAGQEKQEFVEDILSQLESIDAGERQKTVSVWDGHLAAFVGALENNPERMEDVGEALADRVGTDVDTLDRSDVLRLALRLGFQEAAPEEFDAIREAARKQATKNL
jgi:hypothetical protein